MTREEYYFWWDLWVSIGRVADVVEASLLFESEVAMKSFHTYYDVSIDVDGEPLKLCIYRMLPSEFDDFLAAFERYGYSIDGKKSVDPAVPIDRVEMARWLEGVFKKYVAVAPGQCEIVGADGAKTEVLTGEQFIQLFGARFELISQVLALIWGENHIPETHKPRFREGASSLGAWKVKDEESKQSRTRASRAPKAVEEPQKKLLDDATQPATTETRSA